MKKALFFCLGIISIIVNNIFILVLNMQIYTDRVSMPDDTVRVYSRSPVERLYIADVPGYLYLQILFAVVSIISSLLVMFGVKKKIVKIVQVVSFIGSVLIFIIMMIVTSTIHAKY